MAISSKLARQRKGEAPIEAPEAITAPRKAMLDELLALPAPSKKDIASLGYESWHNPEFMRVVLKDSPVKAKQDKMAHMGALRIVRPAPKGRQKAGAALPPTIIQVYPSFDGKVEGKVRVTRAGTFRKQTDDGVILGPIEIKHIREHVRPYLDATSPGAEQKFYERKHLSPKTLALEIAKCESNAEVKRLMSKYEYETSEGAFERDLIERFGPVMVKVFGWSSLPDEKEAPKGNGMFIPIQQRA